MIKDLLVNLTVGASRDVAADYALSVGQAFGAHVAGVAFAYDDPVGPAKIIRKFSEKHNKLALKVCVLEKEIFDGSKLDELAKLPTRKEMIAGILGSIQAPLAGVPNVIHAVLRDLVSVIGQIEKKKAA